MKQFSFCLLLLAVGAICEIDESCTVQDDRAVNAKPLTGKCRAKNDCIKSGLAAVSKDSAGEKLCSGDELIQCCIEIKCGSNKCRNNVEDGSNPCTTGSYQPNFRTHLYCPYTSAEDKVQCCVEKKYGLELRQVFPQDSQTLDPSSLVASASTKAGAAALLPLEPASMPQTICSPPVTHNTDLDGNSRELTIDEIENDGPCYTPPPPSSDVNRNPSVTVNSDPNFPIPNKVPDGKVEFLTQKDVHGAGEDNDFRGGGPAGTTFKLGGENSATEFAIWNIGNDPLRMGTVFRCRPGSRNLFC